MTSLLMNKKMGGGLINCLASRSVPCLNYRWIEGGGTRSEIGYGAVSALSHHVEFAAIVWRTQCDVQFFLSDIRLKKKHYYFWGRASHHTSSLSVNRVPLRLFCSQSRASRTSMSLHRNVSLLTPIRTVARPPVWIASSKSPYGQANFLQLLKTRASNSKPAPNEC